MISDPVFVETHLRNTPNNLFVGRYRKSTEGGFSFVKLEGRKFHAQAVLDSPNRYRNTIEGGFSFIKLETQISQVVLDIPNNLSITILCECNGVLLLKMEMHCSFVTRNYLMWNPSTRRERYLVCPYDEEGYSGIPGICYDPITDDFKVVLIGMFYYAIYSSKNNSWTRKRGLCNNVIGDAGTYFDGSIYWLFCFTKSTMKLVYFDPKTDELKRLDIPERLSDRHYSCLLCSRGSLCLFGGIRDENDVIKHRIWIREKGNVGENPSWRELITFENVPTTFHTFMKPICFVENKILVTSGYSGYAYYSPSEKRFEEFEEKCCHEFVEHHRSSLYGWD